MWALRRRSSAMRRQAAGQPSGAASDDRRQLLPGGRARPRGAARSRHSRHAALALLASAVLAVVLLTANVLRRAGRPAVETGGVETVIRTDAAPAPRRRHRVASLANATDFDSDAVAMISRSVEQPSPNLWDDERAEAAGAAFASLLDADTLSARERALNATVHAERCAYCDFQRLDARTLGTPEGRARLSRVRLDRPVVVYDAVPRLRRWRAELFLGGDAYANATVVMQRSRRRRGEAALGEAVAGEYRFGAYSPALEARRVALREFVRAVGDGRLRESMVFQPVFGMRRAPTGATDLTDPWLDDFLTDVSPPAQEVEDALFRGELGLEYFVGPWRRQLERVKRAYEGARAANDRGAFMSAGLDSDAAAYRRLAGDWARWAQGDLSGEAFAERIRGSEFALSPLLFIGPHLMGSLPHAHERTAQTTLKGFRVWFVHDEAEGRTLGAGLREVDADAADSNSYLYTLKHLDRALYRRRSGRGARHRRNAGFCCQPPGAMVFLPRRWSHTVFGWAEDERTGEPVPIDAVGGLTASISYQSYGKVGYFFLLDALVVS